MLTWNRAKNTQSCEYTVNTLFISLCIFNHICRNVSENFNRLVFSDVMHVQAIEFKGNNPCSVALFVFYSRTTDRSHF